MAMEEEDLSASVIFLGIFLGNGHVFFSIKLACVAGIERDRGWGGGLGREDNGRLQ